MSNISISAPQNIISMYLPSCSQPLGGDLYIDDLTNMTELVDNNGNEIRSISGFSSSNLQELDFSGSNARLSGNFVSSLPSSLRTFRLDSNLSTISGSLPSAWPSNLIVFSLIGNNNTVAGRMPTVIPQRVYSIWILGKKLKLSGGSALDNFLPASFPNSLRNFVVSDRGNGSSTYEGTLPNFSTTPYLTTFNVLGMKLHGALPASLPRNIERFNIGGKNYNNSYHAGLNAAQAFPNCSPSTGTGNLIDLEMTNLRSGGGFPKITTCATNVFERCAFLNNTQLDLRYNAFSPIVTNNILTAIMNAAGSGDPNKTGRVIRLQGNMPPTDLISMSATSGGNADTGNTAINYLLDNNWSIEFTTNGWPPVSWPI